MPLVTVIIPAYNSPVYLPLTLDSVCAQSHNELSIIVVDDGSRDNTADIVAAYAAKEPRLTLIHKPNGGPSAARNRGYEEIDPACEFVIFLDNDDIWEPDAIETLVDAATANPDALAFYGLARYIDGSGNFIDEGVLERHQLERYGVENGRVIDWPLDRRTTFAVEAVRESVITAGTVLIRRRAMELAGLWNQEITMWEDWDLWLRITTHGDMVFVNKPVLRYRKHATNLSNDPVALGDWLDEVRRRLLIAVADDPAKLKIARLGARHYLMHLASQRMGWARECASRGEIIAAVKQVRHAIKLYATPPERI